MQFRAKKILPIIIIAVVLIAIAVLMNSKPTAKKRGTKSASFISVEVLDIALSNIKPKVLSYGLVEPRTRTSLVAQVSGRVESVSEQFKDGGFFRKGDVLLQIDATDYEIAVDIAKGELAQTEQVLAEELARVEQAKIDWKRLDNSGNPNPLALREPQLRAARANVMSSKARLRQAEINLARASIRAPYDGRVLSNNIGLGQVAANNAVLGEIYATDAIEVRLPIKNQDLSLLKLPESYRNQDSPLTAPPGVKISSDLTGKEVWQGSIIRTAGSIDNSSRQLNVVARIDDPFGEKAQGRFPLKIGQYVTAEIDALTLESVISIPNKAIYQGSYVYLYKEDAVYRTPVEIGWQNGEVAIILEGINSGDQLVVSPLGQITSGTPVKIIQSSSEAARLNESEPVTEKNGKTSSADDSKGQAL